MPKCEAIANAVNSEASPLPDGRKRYNSWGRPFGRVPSLSPLKFFHVLLKFRIGYNLFLHQQEAGEILSMQPKFHVNSCMCVDTVTCNVRLCQKRYNSLDRFVTICTILALSTYRPCRTSSRVGISNMVSNFKFEYQENRQSYCFDFLNGNHLESYGLESKVST